MKRDRLILEMIIYDGWTLSWSVRRDSARAEARQALEIVLHMRLSAFVWEAMHGNRSWPD